MVQTTPWRKSSHSGGHNDCVEVAGLMAGAAVRDSKDPAGPVLALSPRAAGGLARAVKALELS